LGSKNKNAKTGNFHIVFFFFIKRKRRCEKVLEFFVFFLVLNSCDFAGKCQLDYNVTAACDLVSVERGADHPTKSERTKLNMSVGKRGREDLDKV